MADQGCPILGNDGVYGEVVTVMEGMWEKMNQAFNLSVNALNALGSLQLNPISFGVGFTTHNDWFTMRRPLAPTRPDLTWDPDFALVPNAPTGDVPGAVSFEAPPTFTGSAPVIAPHTPPGALTATPPAGPPALDPVVVPDAPTITLPDFPELLSIDLPDAPAITLPTFQGARPNFSIHVPTNTFGFNAEQYSSALVDAIRSKLQLLINGEVGLPAPAVSQMRDRAYSAIDTQQLQTEQEAIAAFVARGFSQPDGVLRRELARTRQNAQNQKNSLSRDIYIQEIQIRLDNVKFGVAQGIALESALMQNFLGVQQIAFEAARAQISLAIDVANAEIARANLELEQFKADAEVFRDLIQAELAKIEIYRAQLEGQRLRGELNQQNVSMYAERVRALLAVVEIYKAQVDGAKAKSDVNVSRTQAFLAQVQAYGERVKAYETEWEAYGKQLEADLSQYRRYEIETQIYGTRADIWGKINGNKIDQRRLQLSERELDITAYRARLEKISTVLGAEESRVRAVTSIFASDVDKYRADATIEQVVSDTNLRSMQVAIEQERSRVDTAIKNAQIGIEQHTKLLELLVSSKQAIGQIGATMAAGLASSMSVHAQIGSNLSQSTGCQTTFSYRISGQ